MGGVQGAGHPSSVDAMVAFDADTVLTGSADGLIRIIGILPNAMLGLVGEHAQARACSGSAHALAWLCTGAHQRGICCHVGPHQGAQMTRKHWRTTVLCARLSAGCRPAPAHDSIPPRALGPAARTGFGEASGIVG